MPSIKVFNPVTHLVQPPAHAPTPTPPQCSRLSDLVILLFGIGLGVLLFALAHDLHLRRQRAKTLAEADPARTCVPESAPEPAGEALQYAHSHHLATHVGERA